MEPEISNNTNINQETRPKKRVGCLNIVILFITIIIVLILGNSFYKNFVNEKYDCLVNGNRVFSIVYPKKFHHNYQGSPGSLLIAKSCSLAETLKYSLDCNYNVALNIEVFKQGESGYYNDINQYGKSNYTESTVGGKQAYLFNEYNDNYALIFTNGYMIKVNGIKPHYVMISQSEVDKLLSKLTIY